MSLAKNTCLFLKVSTTPITAVGCRQCLWYLLVLSSWKVNIAQNLIAVMGLYIESDNENLLQADMFQ